MLSKKQIIILISVLGAMLFTNNHVSAAYPGLCIGHNYGQQTPTPGIQEPTVHINGVTTIIEGSTIYLTANAFADEQQGGVKTFFWCTEKGKLEYDPDYQDGSGVKLTAPTVTGASETVKVAVQVGICCC